MWSDPSHPLRIQIRESARSRRLCVRVDRDALVEVVVPRGTPRQRVTRFLAEHEEWIARRVARANPLPPEAFPPAQISFDAIGESWRLHLAGGTRRLKLVTLAPGLLQIQGAMEPAALRNQLRSWVVDRARETLPDLARAFASGFGEKLSGVQVRTQRTRWGSCSVRRVISLNAAILFQTPAVLRYLLAHEVGHLRHMNHSQAFWSTVAQFEPHWRELDRQLLRGWERVPRWFRERSVEQP
ncbi:MAG: SprT family zinc-dependent metalloprotease [Steroidobacteraceae bacterium]